jgi:hypothetical protein
MEVNEETTLGRKLCHSEEHLSAAALTCLATVAADYVNDHLNGFAGHPFQLIPRCTDGTRRHDERHQVGEGSTISLRQLGGRHMQRDHHSK